MTELAGADSSYRACPGGRHWGPVGAAGLLPWTELGGRVHVLLTLRSPHVKCGGTWSTPGGAIERGETPEQAAVAEAREELDGLSGMNVSGSYRAECPHGCGWSYTTFLAQVGSGRRLPRVRVTAGPDSWETDDVAWVPADEVGGYELHPGFAAAWPELAARLEVRS